MKGKLALTLVTIILVTTFLALPTYATEVIKVKFDGEYMQFDVPPSSINGRTMIPMRAIFEKLGYKVEWDGTEKKITAIRDKQAITLYQDKTTATVAIKYPVDITLDVAPTAINGRILVPLRFVAESAGANVSWDNATKTAIIKSLEYQLVEKHMDSPFTQEKLQSLVDKTPVDDKIINFRSNPNSRRTGLEKKEFKYFDLYYPKGELAQIYVDYISKYADTSYMFLTSLYDRQVPVEVHLIHEKDTKGLREGDIRRKEKVAVVYIYDGNISNYNESKEDLGHILNELIHEMYHNFFSTVNNDWDKNDDKWSYFVDEGAARMVPSIYMSSINEFATFNENYHIPYLKSDLENLKRNMKYEGFYPTLDQCADSLFKSWHAKTAKERIMKDTCVTMWMYLYEQYGYEKYQEVLRTMGQNGFKSKIEKIYDRTAEEILNELLNY